MEDKFFYEDGRTDGPPDRGKLSSIFATLPTGLKIATKYFEHTTKFKYSYLRTTLTNQNSLRAKLTADSIRGMLATIRSKIFYLLVSCIKTYMLKYTELQLCSLFDMGEKLDLSH